MLLLSLLIACHSEAEAEGLAPVAASAYIDGMWEQRALTVDAGLDEAMASFDAGREARAAEDLEGVYTGSFEPELEPLIREQLSVADAVWLEYRFGLMREALRRGDRAAAEGIRLALSERLHEGAGELDRVHAVLD